MNQLLKLMHDTMSPVLNIKSSANLIISGSLTKEEEIYLLKAIITKADELNKVLDNYYNTNKETT